MLETLRKDNVDALELFSCGYFSDGTETLLNARDHVTDSGIKKAGFIPCLNESEAFADYLSAKVHKALTP